MTTGVKLLNHAPQTCVLPVAASAWSQNILASPSSTKCLARRQLEGDVLVPSNCYPIDGRKEASSSTDWRKRRLELTATSPAFGRGGGRGQVRRFRHCECSFRP